MPIRHYQAGDESAQARVYNTAAGPLPKFKPATAEEIARRYRAPGFSPETRLYAVENGEVVGYAGFDGNGRISYPWHLPGHESVRSPLLDAVLAAMLRRGLSRAWAAYRADWAGVLDVLRGRGFALEREMINYVADLDQLPRDPVPEGYEIGRLGREALPELLALRRDRAVADDAQLLDRFFWDNPYFANDCLYALRRQGAGPVAGVGLAVIDERFADPTKIDPAMPCFRLGAMGTERERHKRVNGFFSAEFSSIDVGKALLVEAARRMAGAGLAHAAAQTSSDEPLKVRFYDEFFRRQGSFPILALKLPADSGGGSIGTGQPGASPEPRIVATG